MDNLTGDRLKEVLSYAPETGVFTRMVSRRGDMVGKQAGGVNTGGYRYIRIGKKQYRASRLAWLFMEGYFPENQMDHINRIKDDDRWSNLRHVSASCNVRNSGRRKDNTSSVTGVRLHTQTRGWRASIHIDGKLKYLGAFSNFKDAVAARWKAEVKYNWPGCNSHTDAYCYLHVNL